MKPQSLRPHKVTYYLERRDPNFLSRMKDVLLVYKGGRAARPGGLKRGATAHRGSRSLWMKNPACRPLATRRQTCCRWPANIPR